MSKKVCLVDGSGYIFRAFYGLPPLTAPDGTPVNAVYGFTNMFLRLTTKIGCDYCLVLFDAKRQNFRNEIYPDYKGTRKEIPEDLIPQFSIIHKAVEALNLNHLEMEGYEADDLIATYAKQARDMDMEVVIVSGDKDLMQLIRDGVEFYDPMKDKFFTPDDVKEKFGVYPDKVVDVQALSGDSTDNVPGVAGIGPKTAAQLINEYGSLEEVLIHAPEIKQAKRRQTLLDNAQNARISLQLVTLKADVSVVKSLNEFVCRAPDAQKLNDFINSYAFTTLKPRVEKWIAERCSDIADRGLNSVFKSVEKNYILIENEKGLQDLLSRAEGAHICALDAVSDGGDVCGISLAVAPGYACYLPICKTEPQSGNLDLFAAPQKQALLSGVVLAKYLKLLLENPAVLKIGCGLKNAWHLLTQIIPDVEIVAYDDISVLSYDLDSSEHGHSLPELAAYFLAAELPKIDELLGSGKNKIGFAQVDVQAALQYMAERADYILRVHSIIKPRLINEQKTAIYENFDRPLLATLYHMEKNGVELNAGALLELSTYFDKRLKTFEQEAYRAAGEEFNLGSPKQVGDILFAKQGLKGKKTATGAWQTGAEILEEIAAEGNVLAQKILDWRELSKLKSTYTDSLFALADKNSRIHTTYLQTVANTGRLSSVNPNLQNIPIRSEEGKKIRSCFVAKSGCKLISCDYSQVELRLLAAVADVKALKKAFADGIDVHAATASHVFGVPPEKVDANLRRHAKAINFGIVYGISPYGLAKNIGVEAADAKAYIDAYFRQMPEIKQYMEETIAFAHKHGYVLTPFGRKCTVAGINDTNKRLAANAERVAINAPIQGGAADIIKLAMNKLALELKAHNLQTKMLLQVHDELVFEAPETEIEEVSEIIKNTMEKIVDFGVPFNAELGVGNTWTEAH